MSRESEEDIDTEWLTIRSFFFNEKKLQNLVKYSEKLIFDRNIQEIYFAKAAKIYQTVILGYESDDEMTIDDEEEHISDLMEEFIIYAFQLESDISGVDHLEAIDSVQDEEVTLGGSPSLMDNNTIAEVPEEFEDSKANTAKFEVS